MPKFTIYGTASASKALGTIEAESHKDAIEKAWNNESDDLDWGMSLCHQCGDIDIGDIYELHADEETP